MADNPRDRALILGILLVFDSMEALLEQYPQADPLKVMTSTTDLEGED